jgi:hypothetical protein
MMHRIERERKRRKKSVLLLSCGNQKVKLGRYNSSVTVWVHVTRGDCLCFLHRIGNRKTKAKINAVSVVIYLLIKHTY